MCHAKLRVKRYGGATIWIWCWRTFFVSHTHYCNHTLCLLVFRSHTPVSYVYMYKIWPFTGFHWAVPIDRLQLQASEVLPLHYDLHVGMLLHKARDPCTKPLPPFEACPDACKLVGSHIQHYTSLTYWSIIVITGNIATYLQYAISKNSNDFNFSGTNKIAHKVWFIALLFSF